MNKISLKGVSETLLISLNARCNESINPKGLINDKKSLEIAEMVGSDFRKEKSVHLTNVGTGMRTLVFDRYTLDFLDRNPNGTIVNLACGLDTRFHRLSNHKGQWFDLDMPEVIEIRQQIFEENEHFHFIAKSVLDFTWIEQVPKEKPVLITAEGLFCYFTEDEVKSILKEVAKSFPKVELVIEAIAPFMVKKTKSHPSLKGYDAAFKWGVKSGKVIEDWNIGLRFIDEYFFMGMKEARKRSFIVNILATLSSKFRHSMKIFRVSNYDLR